MAKRESKIFVLDTNVLLHDFRCIYNFEDNNIIIPITVLEELDKFKKGNDIINFHAREFTRELDRLSGDGLFNGGIPLGKGLGKLSIEKGKPFSKQMMDSFPEQTPDHRILAITEHIYNNNPKKQVILISKDINLRMKAKSLGILAADYESDKVQNIDEIYKAIYTIDNVDDSVISEVYDQAEGISADKIKSHLHPLQISILYLKDHIQVHWFISMPRIIFFRGY
jgi:PhoH-like ATPase